VVLPHEVLVEELFSWSLFHGVRLFSEVNEDFLGDSLREVHEFVTQVGSQGKACILSLLSK